MASDPYLDIMNAAPRARPDYLGAAQTIANFATGLGQLEVANRKADLERSRLISEESRQASSDLIKIQELSDARRQQDFQNSIKLIDMASKAKKDEIELKSLNQAYQLSEMEFKRKQDEIQSRMAYEQVAPSLLKSMMQNDIVKFDLIYDQLLSIPGIFSNDEVKKAMSEHAAFLQDYRVTVEGKGDISIAEIKKQAVAGNLEMFGVYAKLAKLDPNTFLDDPYIRQTFSAVINANGPEKLKSFVDSKVYAPSMQDFQEDQARKIERDAILDNLPPEQAMERMETFQMMDDLRDLRRNGNNPEAPIDGKVKLDTAARTRIFKAAEGELLNYETALKSVLDKAYQVAPGFGQYDFSKPDTMTPEQLKQAGEVVSGERKSIAPSEEERIGYGISFFGGLGGLMKNMSVISDRRDKLTKYKILMESSINKLKNSPSMSSTQIDSEINNLMTYAGKVNPILRSLNLEPMDPGLVFNRQYWNVLRKQRSKTSMGGGTDNTSNSTIPSTPPPDPDSMFPVRD